MAPLFTLLRLRGGAAPGDRGDGVQIVADASHGDRVFPLATPTPRHRLWYWGKEKCVPRERGGAL
jgi:hypothetical protein